MLEINKMESFALHRFEDFEIREQLENQFGSYSRLRYVRARVKRALKSMVNPTKAPKPIQYHFASVNTARDLRVCTPRVSLEAVLFNILSHL